MQRVQLEEQLQRDYTNTGSTKVIGRRRRRRRNMNKRRRRI